MMRLDRYLALAGEGSRSQIKETVRKGLVSVNGIKVKNADTEVFEGDSVNISGRTLEVRMYEYYILYKPAGYITAKTDPKKPVVMELVPSGRTDLSPAGRLDEDTEGLLLITNDGALAHDLLSPKKHVKKTYYAELDRPLPENAAELLNRPTEFSDFTAAPADAFEKITETSAYLTISEGKFHEVKRLFHAIGCDVTYLKRVSFGPLDLSGMKPGECRRLTEEEVRLLKKQVDYEKTGIIR